MGDGKMKEVMSKEQMFTELFGYLKDSIEFAKGEVPDIIKQFILISTIEASLAIFVGILLVVIAFIAVKHKYENEDAAFPVVLIASIGGLMGTIMIFVNSYFLLMIKFAPKVFLLQEFKRLF
jgi:hypothetical protein